MKNHLIIHGHFYQPPRENPWIGLVPKQPSAAPFHDWNSRITKECYAANSASRILSPDGRIEDIVNNYEYLSFNIGPTLMSQLFNNAPNVYSRIIEADRKSIERNRGHGNAIAQVYNHAILPLCSHEDAKTQIIWGLEDFKHHFGRDSEGIWLAETAINAPVVELLIEQGLKYVILSPWQGEAVKSAVSGEWRELNGHPVPSNKAYRIEGKSGGISVFFYNHILAQGISFDHYLKNADDLYNRVLAFQNDNDQSHLINIATDGEIYGHHEPFGDMCLAAFIKRAGGGGKLEFTNYGRYLELYPPAELVRLKQGEDALGTSWSCPHGVSRWHKDCGCHTGGKEGWNQSWRTPLRDGFVRINNIVAEIYRNELKRITDLEPEQLRNSYIKVICREKEMDAFADEVIADRFKAEDTESRLFRLLEGQKFAMYMFTSCGWFFSELSGLEPVQNIKYALRTIQLYSSFTNRNLREELLSSLENARGNIPEKGTGREIAESLIPPIPESANAAAVLAAGSFFDPDEPSWKSYGVYKLISLSGGKEDSNGQSGTSGEIKLVDTTTLETSCYYVKTEKDAEDQVSIVLKEQKNPDSQSLRKNPADLPEDLKRKFTEKLINPLIEISAVGLYKQFARLESIFDYSGKLGIKEPDVIRKTAELTACSLLTSIFSDPESRLTTEELDRIERIIIFSARYNIDYCRGRITKLVTKALACQIDLITDNIEDKPSKYIFRLCGIIRKGNIRPDITIPQNRIFSLIKKHSGKLALKAHDDDLDALKKLKNLVRLGKSLDINVDGLKERIFL